MIAQKSAETTRPQMKQQHISIVRDAGLILAGGAQKLSGPHRFASVNIIEQS